MDTPPYGDEWPARWLDLAERAIRDDGLIVEPAGRTLVVTAPMRQRCDERRHRSVTIGCCANPTDRELLWFTIDGDMAAPAHRSRDVPALVRDRLCCAPREHVSAARDGSPLTIPN